MVVQWRWHLHLFAVRQDVILHPLKLFSPLGGCCCHPNGSLHHLLTVIALLIFPLSSVLWIAVKGIVSKKQVCCVLLLYKVLQWVVRSYPGWNLNYLACLFTTVCHLITSYSGNIGCIFYISAIMNIMCSFITLHMLFFLLMIPFSNWSALQIHRNLFNTFQM